MPATIKALYRGAAATSSATLYTVPAATTTTITNIVITNTNAAAQTATIALDGVVLVPSVSVPAGSFATFDVKQAISATKLVTGFASATSVNFHISGVEVA